MPQSDSQPSKPASTNLSIMTFLFVLLLIAACFAIIAGTGAAAMVVGNTILSKAHLSGYTSNANAAAIGATGACIAVYVACIIRLIYLNTVRRKSSDNLNVEWCAYILSIITMVITCTLTGVIGCAILRHKVDLGGIDLAHSASAGALGGTLLGLTLSRIFVVLSPPVDAWRDLIMVRLDITSENMEELDCPAERDVNECEAGH